MNDYYNRLFDVLPQTFARSGGIEAEFLRIEQGFDGLQGVLAPTTAEVTAARQGQASLLANLILRAPLASPAFTGVPTAPTAALGTATTQLATTEFMQAAIAMVNAQTALVLSITSSATPAAAAGQRMVMTNSGAVVMSLPLDPAVGVTVAGRFTNGRLDNTIARNGQSIEGFADDVIWNTKGPWQVVFVGAASGGWRFF